MVVAEGDCSFLHRFIQTNLDRCMVQSFGMPEGPEIRRAADRLGKALIGRRIEHCNLPYATFIGREHLIRDQIVIDVTSQAKAMLIRFENGGRCTAIINSTAAGRSTW